MTGRETRLLPIGEVTVEDDGRAVTRVAFGRLGESAPSPLTARDFEQLEAYFAGQRCAFELPLSPAGTPFQRRVWSALEKIPYGHTLSSRALAEAAGSPRAFRAAGQANGRNPIVILIPCHRVTGVSGNLTGYGGGLAVKAALLRLEGSIK